MDEKTERQLDRLVSGRQDLDSATKCQHFWHRVDDLMDKATSSRPTRPLFEALKRDASLSYEGFYSDRKKRSTTHYLRNEDVPSQAQVRTSKGRRSCVPVSIEPTVRANLTRQESQVRMKLTIGPTLHTDVYHFWKTLIDGNTKDTFTWNEFCNAMCGVGYTKKPQAGSGYRFNYTGQGRSHVIVFHKPHGYGDKTMPLRLARELWLARMQRHIDLNLVD